MDILERIMSRKRQRLAETQEKIPLPTLYRILEEKDSSKESLESRQEDSGLKDLRQTSSRLGDSRQNDFRPWPLTPATFNVIAEVKRASPSLGAIPWSMSLPELVDSYEQGGAGVISVLTEEDFFDGSVLDLKAVRELTSLPILRKDFLFTEYQIVESKLIGATAVLLIMSLLTATELQKLLLLVHELGMEALVECHDEIEVNQALEAGVRTIGINNRDLRTFEVDLERTEKLGTLVPQGTVLVSESGIKTAEDVTRVVRAGGSAVLVGESCLRGENPAKHIKDLLDRGIQVKENL